MLRVHNGQIFKLLKSNAKKIYIFGGKIFKYYYDGVPPQNRFWIGGSGIWSDTSHWSSSSGGSGGSSVPNGATNVFFDQNSFTILDQIVTVDSDYDCAGLDFTGVLNNPKIDIRNRRLDVALDCKFIVDMSILSFNSTLILHNGEFYGAGKKFYNVDVQGDLIIRNSNTFKKLNIIKGTILFENGLTQAIEEFIADGTIDAMIKLKSLVDNSQFFISKVEGTGRFIGSYLEIKDSNVGTVPFHAINSQNDGNNIGWTFGDPAILSGSISGNVKKGPLNQSDVKVICVNSATNELIGIVMTDLSGNYSFTELDDHAYHHVSVEYQDDDGKYNCKNAPYILPVIS